MAFFNKRRPLTALFVGAIVALAANLPPQHGHLRSSNHAAVVHRHASLHVGAGAVHGWLGRDDGLVIWIDESYLSEAPAVLGRIDAALPETALEPPAVAALHAWLEAVASRIHGPPGRPFGSRAPPLHLLV
jgi:hypothetical protein